MEEGAEINIPKAKETKKPKIPRWQKEFSENDYNHFLKIAKERTDKNELDRTINNIAFRIEGAEMTGVLPPEGLPTHVARGEYIEVPFANDYLLGRITTIQQVIIKYGKKVGNEYILKYRKTEFKTNNNKEISGDKNAEVFSVTTKFKEGNISVKMRGDKKFAVNIDFPQGFLNDQTPPYNSGYLSPSNLTDEEVNVLARHAIEVGFYNIYGNPSESPYPWEVPSL